MNESTEPLESGETIRGYFPEQLVFGRYVLRKRGRLGDGGVVWLAHDRELVREVALAFLPDAVARDRSAIADFKREIRWALELTHPNIVRVYDFVSENGRAAISMECIDADALSTLRLERPSQVMGVAELGPLVRQLCEVLVYVHRKGQLVHRHLALSCLLVTAAGELKVSDFRLVEQLGFLFPRGRRGARPSDESLYLSPQQRAGEPPAVTDDIYAVGAVLHELVTGRPPPASLTIAPRAVGAVPRSRVLKVLPLEWEETIFACLAEDPASRPQSASEVAKRLGLRLGLGSWKAGGAVGGPENGASPVPDRRIDGFRKWRVLGLAACAVTALCFAGYCRFRAFAPQPTEAASAPDVEPVPGGPQPGANWEVPGLGMKFVPVPGTRVLFSIWETRVQDFEVFVAATGHDATVKMSSYRVGQWGLFGDTWRSPGFPQGPTYPVVGLSVGDAIEFCRWLTDREMAAGRLAQHQGYRLAVDAEWSAAVGSDEFPWGNQWPPPPRAGNYADEAMRRGPPDRAASSIIEGYDDAYEGTSPVGTFAPNRLGIYDLGGNAWERVGRRNGVVRGASYLDYGRQGLRSSAAGSYELGRNNHVGFRVVCEVEAVPERPAR